MVSCQCTWFAQMHGSVRELEANMEQLSLSQQYANRGIYLLCKVQMLLAYLQGLQAMLTGHPL